MESIEYPLAGLSFLRRPPFDSACAGAGAGVGRGRTRVLVGGPPRDFTEIGEIGSPEELEEI